MDNHDVLNRVLKELSESREEIAKIRIELRKIRSRLSIPYRIGGIMVLLSTLATFGIVILKSCGRIN